ncbi:MAG: hypothetical protein ACI8RD_014338 [Bacillariaceae sp.]|jgi:hypothetical protein
MSTRVFFLGSQIYISREGEIDKQALKKIGAAARTSTKSSCKQCLLYFLYSSTFKDI